MSAGALRIDDSLRGRALVLFALLAGAGTAIVLYHQQRGMMPTFGDAAGYLNAGEYIRHHGLLSRWPGKDLRTYGYPAFVSVIIPIAGALGVSVKFAAFVVQLVLYFAAAWFVAATREKAVARGLTFAVLAANPLLVVYSTELLTDSIALSAGLLTLGATMRMTVAGGGRRVAAWCAAGGIAAGLAMAVRPAMVACVLAFGVAVVVCAARAGAGIRPRGLILFASASVLLPLAPQSLINHNAFRSWSPTPHFNLQGIQRTAGLAALRYATNASSCGAPPLFFANPAAPPVGGVPSTATTFRYYVERWPAGPELAVSHLFSAVDPHPYRVYLIDFHARTDRLWQLLTIVILGLAGWYTIVQLRLREVLRRPDGAFTAAWMILTIAILIPSAVELRFGAPLIAVASVVASTALRALGRPRRPLLIIGSVLVVWVVWMTMSDLTLATSPIWRACSGLRP